MEIVFTLPPGDPGYPDILARRRNDIADLCEQVAKIVREDQAGTLPTQVAGTLCDPLCKLEAKIETYWQQLTVANERADRCRQIDGPQNDSVPGVGAGRG